MSAVVEPSTRPVPSIDVDKLPALDAEIPCDGVAVHRPPCPHAATVRVVAHPPRTTTQPCGRCPILLCSSCYDELIRYLCSVLAHPRMTAVCPSCQKRFRAISDVILEVRKL